MSELSDYRRMIERPMIESYETTIRTLRQRVAHLEAVQSDALREYDSAVKALDAPPASPTGRQLGPGKRDELPPIVSEGVEREEIARLIDPFEWELHDYGASRDPPTRLGSTAGSLIKADAIISLLGVEARSALSKATGEGG